MRGGRWFERAMWATRRFEPVCSSSAADATCREENSDDGSVESWPTPVKSNNTQAPEACDERRRRYKEAQRRLTYGDSLGTRVMRAEGVQNWPTPMASFSTEAPDVSAARKARHAKAGLSPTGGTLSPVVMRNWSTPMASFHNVTPEKYDARVAKARASGKTQPKPIGELLGSQVVRNWTTPAASKGAQTTRKPQAGSRHNLHLQPQVLEDERSSAMQRAIDTGAWPTPRESKSEQRTYAVPPSHGTTHGAQLQPLAIESSRTEPSSETTARGPVTEMPRLNPDWVEQLMGFPKGWTDVPALPKPDRRAPAAKGSSRVLGKRNTGGKPRG